MEELGKTVTLSQLIESLEVGSKFGISVIQLFAHPKVLRSLSGEGEHDIEFGFGSVDSISVSYGSL